MGYLKRYYNKKILKYASEKRFTRGFFIDLKNKINIIEKKINLFFAKKSWKVISEKTPIESNAVMFRTYQDNYTCNPKYVCEELLKRNKNVRIIWVYTERTKNLTQFPFEVELIKSGTFEYYKAMAACKYWIDNSHHFTWEEFPKKKDQILINLWHGSMGLKRINSETDTNKTRVAAAKRATKATTYCVTNSKFEEDVFKETYWPNTEFLKFGHARNDIFFKTDEDVEFLKNQIRKELGIPENSKIVLYAPTFRDDVDAYECFDIDYNSLRAALSERFGGEWVVIERLHYHTQLILEKNRRLKGHDVKNYVFTANDYIDIQELLLISDVGITDYSSWICDFVLTKKPGFIFAVDVDSYVNERGFYYSLEETPFPLCKSNSELKEKILGFNNDEYLQAIPKYLDMLGCYENGNASSELVDFILKNMFKNS